MRPIRPVLISRSLRVGHGFGQHLLLYLGSSNATLNPGWRVTHLSKTERLPCRSLPLVHLATGLLPSTHAPISGISSKSTPAAGPPRQQAASGCRQRINAFRASDPADRADRPAAGNAGQAVRMRRRLCANSAAAHPGGLRTGCDPPWRKAARSSLRPERTS